MGVYITGNGKSRDTAGGTFDETALTLKIFVELLEATRKFQLLIVEVFDDFIGILTTLALEGAHFGEEFPILAAEKRDMFD